MGDMRCSICGKTFDPEKSPAMPFCSKRCKDIDANRWLDEAYGLPWETEEERPEGADQSGEDDSR